MSEGAAQPGAGATAATGSGLGSRDDAKAAHQAGVWRQQLRAPGGGMSATPAVPMALQAQGHREEMSTPDADEGIAAIHTPRKPNPNRRGRKKKAKKLKQQAPPIGALAGHSGMSVALQMLLQQRRARAELEASAWGGGRGHKGHTGGGGGAHSKAKRRKKKRQRRLRGRQKRGPASVQEVDEAPVPRVQHRPAASGGSHPKAGLRVAREAEFPTAPMATPTPDLSKRYKWGIERIAARNHVRVMCLSFVVERGLVLWVVRVPLSVRVSPGNTCCLCRRDHRHNQRPSCRGEMTPTPSSARLSHATRTTCSPRFTSPPNSTVVAPNTRPKPPTLLPTVQQHWRRLRHRRQSMSIDLLVHHAVAPRPKAVAGG